MILGSNSDALLKADRRRLEALSEAFSASWTLSTARLAWSFSALFLGALPWRPVTSVFESHWDGWAAASHFGECLCRSERWLRPTVTWLILPVVICLSQRLSHA